MDTTDFSDRTTVAEPRLSLSAKVLTLALIVILASALRLVDLEGRGLWCDELISIERASGSADSMIEALLRVEHVPLFEFALHFWLKWGRADWWIRLLPALMGIAAIGVVYATTKLLLGRTAALAVAFMMAISPYHVFWSRIARPYALLPLVVWIGTYFLVLVWRRGGALMWTGYILGMAASLYTHYFACFVLLAQNICYVIRLRQRRRPTVLQWAAAQAAIVMLFAPWLAANLTTAVRASTEQVYYASQAGELIKLCYFFFVLSVGWTVYPTNVLIVVPAAAAFGFLFVRGVRVLLRKRRAEDWLPLVYVLAMVLSTVVPASSPKHAVPICPAYFMIVALGIKSLRRRGARIAAGVVISALSAASLLNYFTNRQYADVDMVIPWREVCAFVQQHEQANDAVILGYDPVHFRWYYRGQLPTFDLDTKNFAEQIGRLSRHYSRLWLVVYEGDRRDEVEAWLKAHGNVPIERPYQLEEHTLKGLREGWRNLHKYRSYLYKLYLYEPRHARG